MISLVLTLSWKYGDCASTVATQLFFPRYPPMLCSSVHSTEYKFNRSVTVVTVTVLTSSMLSNNLLHDIMSHDRTWFCQISKYRTSGFPWQAEFDTCNAKPFQLLLHAWHYWMLRVVTHILCQGGGLKKCLLSKLQGSAFTRTGTIVTVTALTSSMLYNNLWHDIMSYGRTWFYQRSKCRTSGFTWQAEFDTCNAKSFQLLSRVCNGTTGSSVLLRISCVKLVA